MSKMHAEAVVVIDASADAVYNLLSNYADTAKGHAQILPKQYFRDLQVESGGRGAGTVIRFQAGALGMMRAMRLTISEPIPGRVLAESDTASSLVTRFTVTPIADGKQVKVQIATDWDAPVGPAGLLDRLLMPGLYRRIYRAELAQLAGALRSHDVV